ncbi:MAG: PLP-dependent aminotransferase family protein [Lachnospiraceae bacterium]|nr:PLP-dependent aminotransferase family protein [Lachnospiraceae bacterium]
MKTFEIDKRGRTPIYEYLYRCIRDEICEGRLKKGEKLPSKRNLASLYGISIITVENTYAQLLLEGYITSVQKKGYFVSDIAPISPSVKKNINVKNNSDIFINKKSDLSSNQIMYDNFPYSTWSKIMRKTLLDEEGKFLLSTGNKGIFDLRESIAEYLSESRGLICDPNNIIIGAGTEYLYTMLMQLFGRNGMIAIEDPGHIKVSRIFESNGVRVLHIPVDRDGFDVESLNTTNITAIHISPSHQFPTGIVMPARRRHSIIDFAKKNNCYIIEDDYDSEFRYHGKPIPAMASLDTEHVIYMNTFSKTLAPSVRIAYMVLPEKLSGMYDEKLGFMTCPVSGMEQYTLNQFIAGGYFDRHINRMRNYYRKHRDDILNCLKGSELGKHINIHEENAGLHFLIEIRKSNFDMGRYVRRLAKENIVIKPVNDYSYVPMKKYEKSIVFNYSDISVKELSDILKAMYECLK